MLYKIKANYRYYLYFKYPPTSMNDFRMIDEWQSSVESPFSNSVASFRKSVWEDFVMLEFQNEYTGPRNPNVYDVTINFSREPHQVYDPDNFAHVEREYLSDDETLQNDEVVYIDINRVASP